MDNVAPDWVTQLAPPHVPPPPGWWPLAPGWWGLLILIIIVLAAIIYWNRRPDVRLRRAGLRELKNLRASVTDDIELARELENLMRRFAIARFGRHTVANLSGKRWITFVVEHGGSALSGDSGENLLRAAYGGAAATHRTAWLNGTEAFIKGRA